MNHQRSEDIGLHKLQLYDQTSVLETCSCIRNGMTYSFAQISPINIKLKSILDFNFIPCHSSQIKNMEVIQEMPLPVFSTKQKQFGANQSCRLPSSSYLLRSGHISQSSQQFSRKNFHSYIKLTDISTPSLCTQTIHLTS